MATDWTLVKTVIAAVLQNGRKLQAVREHGRDSSVANSNIALLTQAGALATGDPDENDMLVNQGNFFQDTWVSKAQELFQSYREALLGESDLKALIKNELGLQDEDLEGDYMEWQYNTPSSGQVSIKSRSGFFGRIWTGMVPAVQHILPCTVTFGGADLTKEDGTTGDLTVVGGSMTARSNMATGKLHFVCTEESVTAPKISVVLVRSKPAMDGTLEIEADNPLTPDVSFEDGPTGASNFTFIRPGLTTPTEVDPNALFAAPSTGKYFTSPKTEDCDKGKFFIKVTRQATGDTWLIEVYRLSSRGSDDLVGSTTLDGTVGTSTDVLITCGGGTLFKFNFDKAAANTAMPNPNDEKKDIEFDIRTPRLDDYWTRECTNDAASNYQDKLNDQYPGAELPTNAAPAWANSLAASISMN